MHSHTEISQCVLKHSNKLFEAGDSLLTDVPISKLGASNLSAIELIIFIEDDLNITIDDDEIKDILTWSLDRLINFIAAKSV